jgi:hypothetical protein
VQQQRQQLLSMSLGGPLMGPHHLLQQQQQQPVLRDPQLHAAVLKLQIRHAVSGSVCKMRSIYVKHAILEGSRITQHNNKSKTNAKTQA